LLLSKRAIESLATAPRPARETSNIG
jgi:hypothetical protein